MIGAATKRVPLRACRTLASSGRILNVPVASPGKPATSQAVKADPSAVPGSTAGVPAGVRAKVQDHNEQAAPKKKPFSLLGFLVKATLAASVVYGGTLYAATKNDRVMDFVIDKQLPYYEELVDVIENGSAADIQRLWKKVPHSLGELTHKIEEQGGHLIDETKKKLAHAEEALPLDQLQKSVGVAAVSGTERFPPVAFGAGDAAVKNTVDSFNQLLELLDASALGPRKDTMVQHISDNVAALARKLDALNGSFEAELDARMKDTKTHLLGLHTQKELDLTQNMLDQYSHERQSLEKKYEARLAREVEAARAALSQAAVNATTMVRVEQTRRFEEMVKRRIDEERDGRLKNLDALAARVDEVEKFALGLEEQVAAIKSKTLVQRAAAKLKTLLAPAEHAPAQSFASFVGDLQQASGAANDEVLALAVAELKPLLAHESTQSLLTVPQLLTAWEQLTPELRAASLLPPNAGLLGHFASVFFSKLLMPVKGAKPEGKDIESVIGRVEQSLVRGELDRAVEEVANLKGWTRKLADDWVREGRKRLEAEFLVDLIDTETKVL